MDLFFWTLIYIFLTFTSKLKKRKKRQLSGLIFAFGIIKRRGKPAPASMAFTKLKVKANCHVQVIKSLWKQQLIMEIWTHLGAGEATCFTNNNNNNKSGFSIFKLNTTFLLWGKSIYISREGFQSRTGYLLGLNRTDNLLSFYLQIFCMLTFVTFTVSYLITTAVAFFRKVRVDLSSLVS